MGNRVELPSGGWVETIDLDDIRGGHRKKITTDERFATASNDVARGFAVLESTAGVCIERYNVPYSPFDGADRINMTEADWDMLKVPDQDAISAALEKVTATLFPNAPTPDDMRPGSPTPPAGG